MKKTTSANSGLTSLRIGRGSLGGRLIRFPVHEGLRPTPAKVRAAVFNMLDAFAATHGFLDLCAGSGAMGFQALSMGFQPTVFMELHGGAARRLRANGESLSVDVTVWNRSAYDLKAAELSAGPWVFYGDPPYGETGFHAKMMALLATFSSMSAASLYVAETERGSTPPPHLLWTLWKQKTYGRSQISIYQKKTLETMIP